MANVYACCDDTLLVNPDYKRGKNRSQATREGLARNAPSRSTQEEASQIEAEGIGSPVDVVE